jgi:diguanylate cyclase (GGDEF)-like protein
VSRKDSARPALPSVEDLLRENRELRHKLSRLESGCHAYRDELTGLWNRRYFAERLAEEIGRSRRRSQRRFTIMVVDVNGLKAINDAHSRTEGDLVLRWVAEFLQRTLRTYDVICRVGDDEFAALFPDTETSEAEPLLVRLRATLAKTSTGAPYSISLSFGLAAYPTDGTTCDELIGLAEKAVGLDKRRQVPAATPPSPRRATHT